MIRKYRENTYDGPENLTKNEKIWGQDLGERRKEIVESSVGLGFPPGGPARWFQGQDPGSRADLGEESLSSRPAKDRKRWWKLHFGLEFWGITSRMKGCTRTRNTLAAAAAAKSLQSCPTLCDPIDGSPLGFPVPGILQARTLEWVAISFSNAWKWKVKVKLLSRVPLFETAWTAAYQAPPSMGFSRQEYWSGLPLPSPTKYLPYSKWFCMLIVIIITIFTSHTVRISKKDAYYLQLLQTLYIYNFIHNGLPWWIRQYKIACNAGDVGLIPGLGRSPGERNGNALQYSCLENSMDRGAWWATVHGVVKLGMTEQLTYFTHSNFMDVIILFLYKEAEAQRG